MEKIIQTGKGQRLNIVLYIGGFKTISAARNAARDQARRTESINFAQAAFFGFRSKASSNPRAAIRDTARFILITTKGLYNVRY